MLGRSAGEERWRGVLGRSAERSAREEYWGGELGRSVERSAIEECWGGVLGRSAGEKCWGRVLGRVLLSSASRPIAPIPALIRATLLYQLTLYVLHFYIIN